MNKLQRPPGFTGRKVAVGLFPDTEKAEQAIIDLKDHGFSADQISVAIRNRKQQGILADRTGTQTAGAAVHGALGGGLIGGVGGWLVGIGALAIPGVSPVMGGLFGVALGVAGNTAAAGAGIGAAAGGLLGVHVGLGLTEEEIEIERHLWKGGVVVTVKDLSRILEAMEILERHSGVCELHPVSL